MNQEIIFKESEKQKIKDCGWSIRTETELVPEGIYFTLVFWQNPVPEKHKGDYPHYQFDTKNGKKWFWLMISKSRYHKNEYGNNHYFSQESYGSEVIAVILFDKNVEFDYPEFGDETPVMKEYRKLTNQRREEITNQRTHWTKEELKYVSTLEEYAIDYTHYKISCDTCEKTASEEEYPSSAAQAAYELGFRITKDGLFCKDCVRTAGQP